MFLVVIQRTFLMRTYSSRLNILCYFWHAFIFFGTNTKGTIFSGRVRLHPSQLSQLHACCIRDFFNHRNGTKNKKQFLSSLSFLCPINFNCCMLVPFDIYHSDQSGINSIPPKKYAPILWPSPSTRHRNL